MFPLQYQRNKVVANRVMDFWATILNKINLIKFGYFPVKAAPELFN